MEEGQNFQLAKNHGEKMELLLVGEAMFLFLKKNKNLNSRFSTEKLWRGVLVEGQRLLKEFCKFRVYKPSEKTTR